MMKHKNLLLLVGFFLSAIFGGFIVWGGLVKGWFAGSKVYAKVEKAQGNLSGLGSSQHNQNSKGGKNWIEGTKGWAQNGNYLYPAAISDSVGIGTNSPTAKLHITGKVKIVDGTQDAGKVLTSDANGFASWATPSGGIPAGMIVMWSGTLTSVPSGWALCDGRNGTPDLRDKFIYGWTDGVDPGGTGGTVYHTHEVGTYAAPAHTHAYNEVPTHTHTIDPPSISSSSVSAGTPSGRVKAQYYSLYMAATSSPLDYLESKNGGSSGSYDPYA